MKPHLKTKKVKTETCHTVSDSLRLCREGLSQANFSSASYLRCELPYYSFTAWIMSDNKRLGYVIGKKFVSGCVRDCLWVGHNYLCIPISGVALGTGDARMF